MPRSRCSLPPHGRGRRAGRLSRTGRSSCPASTSTARAQEGVNGDHSHSAILIRPPSQRMVEVPSSEEQPQGDYVRRAGGDLYSSHGGTRDAALDQADPTMESRASQLSIQEQLEGVPLPLIADFHLIDDTYIFRLRIFGVVIAVAKAILARMVLRAIDALVSSFWQWHQN